MTIEQLLFALGGISISVISYFLKMTMNEIRQTKDMAIETRQKLAVLEIDYINKVDKLNSRIDTLQSSIEKLTDKIDELNKNIKAK